MCYHSTNAWNSPSSNGSNNEGSGFLELWNNFLEDGLNVDIRASPHTSFAYPSAYSTLQSGSSSSYHSCIQDTLTWEFANLQVLLFLGFNERQDYMEKTLTSG